MEINRDDELLRKESLKEDNFSSHVHAVDTLMNELGDFARMNEFEIPTQYNINTLVFLPVNVQTSFVYWEINEDFVKQQYPEKFEYFVIKAVERNGNAERDLTNFKVRGNVGTYYFNYYAPNRSMYLVLGLIDKNGNFVQLLSSNVIVTPSDLISHDDDEVWMSKMSDWVEIIQASLERMNVGDSSSLVKEMEMLKRRSKMRVDVDVTTVVPDVSSHEFLGSSELLGGSENLSSFSVAGSNQMYKDPKKDKDQ